MFEEQERLVPPFCPEQVQFHFPVEEFFVTVDEVPEVQRFEVGAFMAVFPDAVPQTPFIGAGCLLAEQLAFIPP